MLGKGLCYRAEYGFGVFFTCPLDRVARCEDAAQPTTKIEDGKIFGKEENTERIFLERGISGEKKEKKGWWNRFG